MNSITRGLLFSLAVALMLAAAAFVGMAVFSHHGLNDQATPIDDLIRAGLALGGAAGCGVGLAILDMRADIAALAARQKT